MILAEREYSRVLLCEGGAAHLRKSLTDWENELPFPNFVRVRRGTIVNTSEISRIQRQGRKVTLHLAGGGGPVAVSYRFAPTLNRALRQTARSELG